MAQRRFHYVQAFEHYLRANRIPYVAVDEAKKSLIPLGHGSGPSSRSTSWSTRPTGTSWLMSRDGCTARAHVAAVGLRAG